MSDVKPISLPSEVTAEVPAIAALSIDAAAPPTVGSPMNPKVGRKENGPSSPSRKIKAAQVADATFNPPSSEEPAKTEAVLVDADPAAPLAADTAAAATAASPAEAAAVPAAMAPSTSPKEARNFSLSYFPGRG